MTPALTGREHDLKTWPAYYDDVASCRKPWELRENDRGYSVGDVLNLREWDPHHQSYTGRSCRRVVTYILHMGFGLKRGWVVMTIAPAPRAVPTISKTEQAAVTMIGVAAFVLWVLWGISLHRRGLL